MARGVGVDWPIGSTRVIKTIAAGRTGSRRWGEHHGDALVNVRHRVDALGLVRYTTVELVVEGWPLHPARFAKASFGLSLPAQPDAMLAQLLRDNGARWDAHEGVWRMRGDAIWRLGLVPCIVLI